ncbi:MAG TPA: hypothetical protein VFN10_23710 [Thermoanaerobaculia bacterium]|nr:hypothetical protein [Thermoanaerobaculia bacterium]
MALLLRSRIGNVILAVVGAIYAVCALVMLCYFVAGTWQAASMTDRLLQAALVFSLICGIWFIDLATRNLGLRSTRDRAPVPATAAVRATAH